MEIITNILAFVYFAGLALTLLVTFFSILAWSVFERGIVLGGLIGLFVGLILGWISAWLWPVVVPLLLFNRNKVRLFVYATIQHMREKAGII